jgi:hypothetical protein
MLMMLPKHTASYAAPDLGGSGGPNAAEAEVETKQTTGFLWHLPRFWEFASIDQSGARVHERPRLIIAALSASS